MTALAIRRKLALIGLGAALLSAAGACCDDGDCSSEITVQAPLPAVTLAEISYGQTTLVCDEPRAASGACEFMRLGDGAVAISFPIQGEEPAMIAVRLLDAAGAELLSSSVTPDYNTYRPNGPSCDPRCRLGAVRLDR